MRKICKVFVIKIVFGFVIIRILKYRQIIPLSISTSIQYAIMHVHTHVMNISDPD